MEKLSESAKYYLKFKINQFIRFNGINPDEITSDALLALVRPHLRQWAGEVVESGKA